MHEHHAPQVTVAQRLVRGQLAGDPPDRLGRRRARAGSSQTAIEHLSLPYDPATRRLFGVPVTTSNAQTAGVGHVIASGAVALDTDTRGVDVQWSENATADSFGKNLVFARCESRYATSVFSPLGVVTLDLTA